MNTAEEEKFPKLHCCKCGRKATIIFPMFRDRMHRLELPVFLCHICGLFYIDEKIIKKIIKKWRKGVYENESLKSLCSEYLEKLNAHWRGYKKAVFYQVK
jgi:hypothetical protein